MGSFFSLKNSKFFSGLKKMTPECLPLLLADPERGGGGGGTLSFSSYVGSGPAFTVHKKKTKIKPRNFKRPKNI